MPKRGLLVAGIGIVLVAFVGAVAVAATDFIVDPASDESRVPSSEEEAQAVLDADDDPAVILHELSDGTWASMDVFSGADGLPDWIETTKDFAEFDVDQRIKGGELASADRDEAIEVQLEQIDCVMREGARGRFFNEKGEQVRPAPHETCGLGEGR